MTTQQEDRLAALGDWAIKAYLDDTDFNAIDWLYDEEDKEEYCGLWNSQFDEKNCLCGEHKEWQ